MFSSEVSVHISSLVVHCIPESLPDVMKMCSQIPHVDVATYDKKGKVVLLLETETEAQILSIIDKIQPYTGVMSATMVYHEFDC